MKVYDRLVKDWKDNIGISAGVLFMFTIGALFIGISIPPPSNMWFSLLWLVCGALLFYGGVFYFIIKNKKIGGQ